MRSMLLVAALVMALALPTAAASELRVEVPAFAEPLPVEAPGLPATLTVQMDCNALDDAGAEPVLTLRVTGAPAWADVNLAPERQPVDPASCDPVPGSLTVQANLTVAATRDAPAFKPAALNVSATLTGGAGTVGGEGVTIIQADFYGILDVEAEVSHLAGKPQARLHFPVTVRNLGNGETQVRFEAWIDEPGWEVIPPPPVTLESALEGGERTARTLNVTVQTPYRNGHVDERATVHVSIEPVDARNTSRQGEASSLTLTAAASGFYAPAPTAAWFVPAVAAAALGARRKRGG